MHDENQDSVPHPWSGVAPLRPAECIIFRIGQWTRDKPAWPQTQTLISSNPLRCRSGTWQASAG